MRQAGDDEAGETSHDQQANTKRGLSKLSP